MTIKKLLGKKIRKLRKESGISQESFAEMINLTPRQIVRIESGESFPSAENIEKIAFVLNIEPQELFLNNIYESKEILKTKITKTLEDLSLENLKILSIITNYMK